MAKIETTGHRFIDLRKTSARCTCGNVYAGEVAEMRAAHRAHKTNPTPAKKATARKPAAKAAAVKPVAKPRARKSA